MAFCPVAKSAQTPTKLGIMDGPEEDESVVAVVQELFCDAVATTPEEVAQELPAC